MFYTTTVVRAGMSFNMTNLRNYNTPMNFTNSKQISKNCCIPSFCMNGFSTLIGIPVLCGRLLSDTTAISILHSYDVFKQLISLLILGLLEVMWLELMFNSKFLYSIREIKQKIPFLRLLQSSQNCKTLL